MSWFCFWLMCSCCSLFLQENLISLFTITLSVFLKDSLLLSVLYWLKKAFVSPWNRISSFLRWCNFPFILEQLFNGMLHVDCGYVEWMPDFPRRFQYHISSKNTKKFISNWLNISLGRMGNLCWYWRKEYWNC